MTAAVEANMPPPAADRLIEAGHVLEDRGELQAALGLYLEAVEAAPRYARAWMNAGNALRKLQRWQEAESAQRRAVDCAPGYAPSRFNLGLLLEELGNVEEAERELLHAVRLQPDLVDGRIVLAELYETLDRPDEAEEQFHKILAIDPSHCGALLNLGAFRLRHGRLEEASELLDRARAIDPGLRDMESSVLFSLNLRTDLDAHAIAGLHRSAAKLIGRRAPLRANTWANQVDPDRRLRVGYVSADFVVHPVALFLLPVLQNHDAATVEAYCYSNKEQVTPVGDSLRAHCKHWCDISTMSDDRFIDQVRQDAIDILVDLSGHTNGNRLAAFASHPAPVQLTWLGYLNTTGLDAMDYRICDRHTDPPGLTEAFHTEKLLRMPDSQWCYVPWHQAEVVSRPENPDVVVFGSFNQVAKFNDVCVHAWSRILSEVANSRLVVLDVNRPAMRKWLTECIARREVSPDRLMVRGRESIAGYYDAIGNSDIGLDTFPYNGATTTLDALWMGVPVVALRGDRSVSRSTYSILKTLGADELIANSLEEYIELNIRLATEHAWRNNLRSTLRERLQASALMDAPRFVRELEARFRCVWRTWCGSRQATR